MKLTFSLAHVVVTRHGVEVGTDAARQFATRCQAHQVAEVWPSAAAATFASQSQNRADWCPSCASEARQKQSA